MRIRLGMTLGLIVCVLAVAVQFGNSLAGPPNPKKLPATPKLVPRTVDLMVESFQYTPNNVTINVGDTARWTWLNGSHSVTSDTNQFNSGLQGAGHVFQHTFNTPGSFRYHCLLHGGVMRGMVQVQN